MVDRPAPALSPEVTSAPPPSLFGWKGTSVLDGGLSPLANVDSSATTPLVEGPQTPPTILAVYAYSAILDNI